MSRYSEEARDGAAADAADAARDEAIANCKEADPVFVWKWRIVESASEKVITLRQSADPANQKKAKDLARRIKHLSKWCEEQISEELYAMADHAAEEKDPYGYRGLSRSMFI
jgi:ABC-type nitrate/sulfonate/bicarbonate transport system substrate-binding protein